MGACMPLSPIPYLLLYTRHGGGIVTRDDAF